MIKLGGNGIDVKCGKKIRSHKQLILFFIINDEMYFLFVKNFAFNKFSFSSSKRETYRH